MRLHAEQAELTQPSSNTLALSRATPARALTPALSQGEREADLDLPMVLHARVVAGNGGGPDKTILRSAAYIDPDRYRMAAAYMHPQGEAGIAVLRGHARRWRCPFYEVAETGPVDPRTVRSMLQVCQKLRVAVWHGHDYKSNALGLLLRRLWPMRLVTTVHGWTNETARTRLYYHIDNMCLRGYDRVIAVSPPLFDHCLRHGVERDRLTFVPNAIEPAEFKRVNDTKDARYALGVSQDAFVIGVVGRFSPEKGIDRAIETLADLRRDYTKAELHLIGDGPEYERLRALCRKLNVTDAVHFWGWQSQLQRFYETMDTLLVPSHTEGLPNVALEAMSMRVPVAATDVGGVRHLLKDGRRGVVLSRDRATWARCIAPLIVSPVRRQELAHKGRLRIKKYFAFRQRMDAVMGIYDNVLSIDAQPQTLRRAA
jgi:glycosyltransferase involved in cell wall biosynthesis